MNTAQLPIARPLFQAYRLSYLVGFLAAVSSLAGLLFQTTIYPSEDLRLAFVSNDVVNLFIGLPILFGSIWLARRGRLIGLLFWPGALFYFTYNYIAYAVAMPFTLPFLSYLTVALVSLNVLFRILTGLNSGVIQQQLAGTVPERFAGGVLVFFGLVFFLWRTSLLVQALTGGTTLPRPEMAVVVADLVIAPVWIVGGVQLWRRKASGYVIGPGLLFHASMLFIGLLVFFILQPILTTAPFPVTDFVVIFSMGLIFFIPFGLFVRGIVAKSPS